MRILRTLCAGMVLVGLQSLAMGATCSIAPDGMAVVDGKRTFVVGLYENPKDDAVLKRVAESGFNLVRSSESTEALDRLHNQGLWAWINTHRRIDLSDDSEKRAQELADMAAQWGKHPALLVWEVPDEALWNCWYGAMQYRFSQEPDLQRKKVAALDDKVLAEELAADIKKVKALRESALYVESEQLADSIWERLGEKQPRPGYGVSTAPARAAKMCGGMVAGYKKLRALDPAHPVWMNHAPRNQIAQLAAFNKGADIVGCDIYPVPYAPNNGHSDLRERSLAAVGAYTDRMQAAAPKKPVWMVLQGFGWDDLHKDRNPEPWEEQPRPTLAQTRFMAWDTIVHGARGILYWGTAYIEKNSDLWDDLMVVAKELSALQPVLSAPDAKLKLSVTLEQSFGSIDRDVKVLAKGVDGAVWLIAVNECRDALTATIKGLKGRNGTRYSDKEHGVAAAVAGDALTISMPGRSFRVLAPE